METYLTVREVAELLRLNPQTIRNWIDRVIFQLCVSIVGGSGSGSRTSTASSKGGMRSGALSQ